MALLYTPTKTGSADSVGSVSSLNSVSPYSTSAIPSSAASFVASSATNVHSGTTTTLGHASKSTPCPRKITVSPPVRVSPKRSNTLFHNSKLGMASVKIAELRQANDGFKTAIADLKEESDKFKDTANTAFAIKDKEIKILKSNAWLDDITLRQKDDDIAALKRCLDMHHEDGYEKYAEAMLETQKLNLSIIDLSRVKKELMEEIHALEARKEALEFA